METKYGFTLMTITEFENWIVKQQVARTIILVQQHHTAIPSYIHFTGSNHFERQRSMQDDHKVRIPTDVIAQHFTIFPDGKICTGRTLERAPACLKGANQNGICFEYFGNFDKGGDTMTSEQRDSILRATAAVVKRFNIPVTTNGIVYHHWYDLGTGQRKNGAGSTKSCPGTNFFGGNKVEDCEANFIPLIRNLVSGTPPPSSKPILKYGSVTTGTLTIRNKPSGDNTSSMIIGITLFGSILRIYEERNKWYKISASKNEWVYSNFVKDVKRATIKATSLNVRSGPSKDYPKIESILQGEEVFEYESENGWSKISIEDKWVSTDHLSFV